MSVWVWLGIALLGGLGGAARFLIDGLVSRASGADLPWGPSSSTSAEHSRSAWSRAPRSRAVHWYWSERRRSGPYDLLNLDARDPPPAGRGALQGRGGQRSDQPRGRTRGGRPGSYDRGARVNPDSLSSPHIPVSATAPNITLWRTSCWRSTAGMRSTPACCCGASRALGSSTTCTDQLLYAL